MPARSNEAQAHLCSLTTFFIASWARGYGLAKMLIQEAEKEAKNQFTVITLEVRETQKRAIQIYNQAGFNKSGENPKSVLIGHKYYSDIIFIKIWLKNDNFQIYPAVDLKDGNCVRLLHGKQNKMTIYEDDPIKQLEFF